MRTLSRIAWAATAALLLSHAAALKPVEGTEVVVTDAGGHQLVGYGVVKNGLLLLRMGASRGGLVLLLVAPDGTVESLRGVRGAGGAVMVAMPDGTRENLSALLSKDDVALRILPQKGAGETSRTAATSGGGGSGGASSGGSSSDGSSSDGSSSDGSDQIDIGVNVGTDGP